MYLIIMNLFLALDLDEIWHYEDLETLLHPHPICGVFGRLEGELKWFGMAKYQLPT